MAQKSKRRVIGDSGFDWDEANEEGLVLFAYPLSKLACFANKSGEVVLVAEECDRQVISAFSVDEALDLMQMLSDAIAVAEPLAMEREAEYLAHCAVEKAMGEGCA